MADFLLPNRSASYENIWHSEYTRLKVPNVDENSSCNFGELAHSKSDDLILQTAPWSEPEIHHGVSDAAIQIQKEACVVYDDFMSCCNNKLLPFCDNEINSVMINENSEILSHPPEIISCSNDGEFTNPHVSRCLDSRVKADPEHSIKEMISRNDLYKFVLFKQHYEEYLDVSQKYEEARTISYYLEEKYHEVKNQRDSLIESNDELKKKVEWKDHQLMEKEEELFQLIEKVFRLEEDCEKLRKEKEKIEELKEQFERDKNELYKQLKLQADESENIKQSFEKTRNDLIRQFSDIVLEKNHLEKENTELKEIVGDLERKVPFNDEKGRPQGKNLTTLREQMTDLKEKAKQSATLYNQLKKGMKHLATCRRRKCSVCAYTRSTFGEYSKTRPRRNKLAVGCFPFHHQDHHQNRCNISYNSNDSNNTWLEECSSIAKRLSEISFVSEDIYLPAPLANSSIMRKPSHIPFIDDCSSANASASEDEIDPSSESNGLSSVTEQRFRSDSGFSSVVCESSSSRSKSNSLNRTSKWTSSFRKLIRRVSSKKQSVDGT